MQIKVKDTRMHKPTSSYGWKGNFEIPVAEAKLVLVECKPEEALLVKPQDHWMLASFAKTSNGYPTQWLKYPTNTFFKPVLISETEKIEVGEWFYDSQVKHIRQYEGVNDNINLPNKYCFKILALPEHFSPKHLQAIVDGKMKQGDKVLVECEKDHLFFTNAYQSDELLSKEGLNDVSFEYHKIKLNSSNHITLHKVEEKMIPLSKAIEAIRFTIKEWVSQKEKRAVHPTHEDLREQWINTDLKEWFEQNVK